SAAAPDAKNPVTSCLLVMPIPLLALLFNYRQANCLSIIGTEGDAASLQQAYERLKEMHANAYSWEPPELPAVQTSVTRRMRSYVRRWVNEWDLRRLYPGVDIQPEDEQDNRPTYEADKDLEVASEPEDEEINARVVTRVSRKSVGL
ncbi:MAG: hypothetical protein ACRD1C_13935, partial [Terriglobales bacterium]